MGKIIIDPSLKGKELTKFLLENKDELIRQKKSLPVKFSDPISYTPTLFYVKGESVSKATGESPIPPDADSFRVKVVANAALWCDSHMDVLLPDCWKKSIADRKGLIPHLHDHIHQLGAEVGDVANIYSQDLSLTDLGVSRSGTTQALIFETDIRKSYNEMIFNRYKAGKIKQHSIGLRYVRMELAINDEESEKQYDFWSKYYEKIINKEVVDEAGYFWVISEIILMENSAVLFGSNQLTPTLEISSSPQNQPLLSTGDASPQSESVFNLSEAIANLKFFN